MGKIVRYGAVKQQLMGSDSGTSYDPVAKTVE